MYTTVLGSDSSKFLNYDRNRFIYNNWGLLSSAIVDTWEFGKWTRASEIRIDYELFWPTGVPSVPIPTANLAIYPVPAADVMSIACSFNTAQAFTATITDMQGRVLRKWNGEATKDYRRTIPVADLPAGVYVLRMEGESERAVKQFIVK